MHITYHFKSVCRKVDKFTQDGQVFLLKGVSTMKVSTRGEYALRALILLAKHSTVISISEISGKTQVPVNY